MALKGDALQRKEENKKRGSYLKDELYQNGGVWAAPIQQLQVAMIQDALLCEENARREIFSIDLKCILNERLGLAVSLVENFVTQFITLNVPASFSLRPEIYQALDKVIENSGN